MRQLADQFPGFKLETLFGEQGWGAAATRDDVRMEGGRRNNLFSRLEMIIRPPNEYRVLELAGKATIHNREVFKRSHYEKLADVDPASFGTLVDAWTLEYAEIYAARG
jgi:hypothetical protein